MLIVSVLLLTAWLGALTLSPTNGFIHLLAMTAVLAVVARRSPRQRRAAIELRDRLRG